MAAPKSFPVLKLLMPFYNLDAPKSFLLLFPTPLDPNISNWYKSKIGFDASFIYLSLFSLKI